MQTGCSSDSGSLVVDKITSGGVINSPVKQRVFWPGMEGLVAAVLLLIGGEQALHALQTAVISAGLPLAVILTMMAISLIRGIQEAHTKQMKLMDQKKFEKFLKGTDESKINIGCIKKDL